MLQSPVGLIIKGSNSKNTTDLSMFQMVKLLDLPEHYLETSSMDEVRLFVQRKASN